MSSETKFKSEKTNTTYLIDVKTKRLEEFNRLTGVIRTIVRRRRKRKEEVEKRIDKIEYQPLLFVCL